MNNWQLFNNKIDKDNEDIDWIENESNFYFIFYFKSFTPNIVDDHK